MPNEQTLERHHEEQQNVVAVSLEKLRIPPHEALLVGSGSIVHQIFEQFLNRRPGDFDFYVMSEIVWKYLQTIGEEIAGPIGNTIIKITVDGWEMEFFQHLPGLSERMTKKAFKKGKWINGVFCMDLITLAVWKFSLSRNKDRAEHKRLKDRKDLFSIAKNVFEGTLYSVENMLESSFKLQAEN